MITLELVTTVSSYYNAVTLMLSWRQFNCLSILDFPCILLVLYSVNSVKVVSSVNGRIREGRSPRLGDYQFCKSFG